jgi:hypothetical protein
MARTPTAAKRAAASPDDVDSTPMFAAIPGSDALPDLQQLMSLQATLAAQQITQMAQIASTVLSSLLDMQRQWLQQFEAGAAQATDAWLASNGEAAKPQPSYAALEPPTDTTPMGMLNNAQAAWTEWTRAWLNAVSHDMHAATGRE